jgi:PAS domain S-box-containing protein
MSCLLAIATVFLMYAYERELNHRKQVNDERQQREAGLHQMAEQMKAVLRSTNNELRFTLPLGNGIATLELQPNQAAMTSLFEYLQKDNSKPSSLIAPHHALQNEAIRFEIEHAGRNFDCNAQSLRDSKGNIIGTIGFAMDITEHKQLNAEMKVRVRQQAAIAGLGHYALAGTNLSTVIDEALALVTNILEVEYCEVLELFLDGSAMFVLAGVGWNEGYVGCATVGVGSKSQGGYTLLSKEPVIVEDLQAETRFVCPPSLLDHKIVSSLSVIIHGPNQPFGVLAAYTIKPRTFTQDDVHFLQAVANVLATVIERKRAEEALRQSEERYRTLVERVPDGVYRSTPEGKFIDINPAMVKMLGYESKEELMAIDIPTQLYFDPKEREFAVESLRQAGKEAIKLFRLRRKDGQEIWVEDHGRLVYDAEGKVLYHEGILREVSRRQKTEHFIPHHSDGYSVRTFPIN